MTNSEIIAAIKASSALRALADAGSDSELAEALSNALPSVPRTGTLIGERGIYALLGSAVGEVFLQTVEALAASTDPLLTPFKRVDRWLKDPIGLDIGNIEAHATLLSMTSANGGPFSDSAVAALVAYGSRPQVVSVDEVSAALNKHRPGGVAQGLNWEAIS